MSDEPSETLTFHALLVAWGQFAQSIGLINQLQAIPVHQKTVDHSPQGKIIEFLVAILAGLEHLKDLSVAAHPIAKDQAVAKAWLQPGWAHSSGVSRTLTRLTPGEAEEIAVALEQITQPFLDEELIRILQSSGRLIYDGDLTARPVSNTSTTYPDVAYGYMSDGVQLGYQAALVSLHSPTYGRFWLKVTPHPGNTVSSSQAEALIRAAETRTGFRPWRRTDWLSKRIKDLEAQVQQKWTQIQARQSVLDQTRAQLSVIQEQGAAQHREVQELSAKYQASARPERPYSTLAKARRRLEQLRRKQERLETQLPRLEEQVHQRWGHWVSLRAAVQRLQERWEQYEQDNRTNLCPVAALFRLDAGFGSPENVALLIEMGYETYTKPCSNWLTARLKRRTTPKTCWIRVGGNAEMVAWASEDLADFPYPLDLALERFEVGSKVRYSTLMHFGTDAVTTDLPGWFQRYNARQLIEAGIKEGKMTFAMHHLKVRTAPALFLQEQFAVFAANFVRWAARWLAEQCSTLPTSWQDSSCPHVKEQVKIGAHTSAWVDWQDQGCLLRFTEHSLFAGRSLDVSRQWAIQLPLPLMEKAHY
jgi:hypothetical protein